MEKRQFPYQKKPCYLLISVTLLLLLAVSLHSSYQVAAAPKGSITGRVTDSATGLNIQGATVSYSGPSSGQTATTSSGTYSVSNLNTGSYQITASKSGYQSQTKSGTVPAGGSLTANFQLVQLALGSITGRVTDAVSGAGVSGVSVSCSGAGSGSATSDASGYYTISGLVSGSYQVSASKSGYQSQTKSATLVAGGSATVNFQLQQQPVGSITGRVTASVSGGGISGASVSCSGAGSGSATSDASGYYTISSLTPGSYTVSASKSGYQSQTKSAIVPAGGSATVNFQLQQQPVGSIKGRVTDVAGRGISKAFVSCTGAGSGSASSDANGNYTISGLVPGSYQVSASATGYDPSPVVTVSVPAGGSATANLQLKPSVAPVSLIDFRSSGLDSDAGSATVLTIDSTPYNYSQLQSLSFSWTPGSTHTVVGSDTIPAGSGKQYVFLDWTNGDGLSGSNGTYTVPTSDTTPTANWQAQYFLSTSANFGSVTPATGWQNAGSQITISATAPSASSSDQYVWNGWNGTGSGNYTGTKNLAENAVTMNSSITEVASWTHQFQVTFVQSGLSSDVSGTVVTVDGAARVYGSLPFGEWVNQSSIVIFGYSPTVSSSVSGRQYVLTGATASSPLTVSGEVTVTGSYKTQYQVSFVISPSGGGSASPSGASIWEDSGTLAISATPNSGYTFSSWTGTGSITIASTTSSSTTATVSGTGAITANFQILSGSISGRVTDSGGAGLSGATVQYSGSNASGSVTTDSGGNYVLSNLTLGSYSISVSKTGYSSQNTSQIVAGSSVNAYFQLNPLSPIASTSPSAAPSSVPSVSPFPSPSSSFSHITGNEGTWTGSLSLFVYAFVVIALFLTAIGAALVLRKR
jgi:protocatechuate 3,4-dioxygenase beta subunit